VRGSISSDDVNEAELPKFELLSPMDPTGRLERILGLVSEENKNKEHLKYYSSRIRILEGLFAKYCRCEELPYIYPVTGHCLGFGWDTNMYILSLDVETMRSQLTIGADTDVDLNLNDAYSWNKLCGSIPDGSVCT